MIFHLLILLAGILLGFNFGVIVYALCLARAHRQIAPPNPGHQVHIITTAQLGLWDAQRIAAYWRLQ